MAFVDAIQREENILLPREAQAMGSSDWYVWVVGGFVAFVFDVTMNNARLFEMFSGFIRSAGF